MDAPVDDRIERLRNVIALRPGRTVERRPEHREAAVAIVLRPREKLELLLIRRAELPGDPWSGHVALPGGRRARGDRGLLDTALRETEEEVGIPIARVGTLIGPLDEVAPATPLLPPILISPWVVAVPPDTTAVPDPREVKAALWVPIHALREPGAVSTITVETPQLRRRLPSLIYEDYEIWGLTLRIVQQLLRAAEQL